MTLNESLSLPERLRLRALVFGESVTAKLLRVAADEIEDLRERIAEGLEECQVHQWELEKLRGEWGQ